MHTWLFFNEKVSIVPASWPIIEPLWIGAIQGERAWTLSTKNCWEVFLWRRFATMQFAHVNTWANWVATLVTTKFSFMFRSKAQLSPHWRSKQLLTTLIRWHKASIDFQRKNNSARAVSRAGFPRTVTQRNTFVRWGRKKTISTNFLKT